MAHSVSGETAAIGVGFLLGGPVGAFVGGALAPAALAALMWRGRSAEHDANSNTPGTGSGASDRSGSRSNGGGGQGRGHGGNGTGGSGGRSKSPSGAPGNGSGGGHRKPKDPILDKLSKGLDKLKPNKGAGDVKGPKNNTSGGKSDRPGKDPQAPKAGSGGAGGSKSPKGGKGRGWLNDRGPQPDSVKPWEGRGEKPKKDKKKGSSGPTSSTARDGLDPKGPKGGGDGVVEAELVDDDLPPKPDRDPDDVIDVDVVDEDRIALVRKKREKAKRRKAIKEGKRAADQAARDGSLGDPHQVRREVTAQANRRIDLELHHENQRLALTAAAETPRSTPVNYPAIQAAPAGTRTAGVAVARQVDFRGSTAYAILRAMADQLANGLHHDDDADMGDHIVELTGIPNMCKNLSTAVQEAGRALARTAPLHPSVIKHLNNAAVAARSAGMMADNIMIVFVQAHREDIIRVLDPRIGEERWNLRNGPGTLDAAKLRAAISSAHSARLALPAGTPAVGGGSKLVPASDGSTKKLINLMKNFTRGHMVNVLSEVAGAAAGVEAVADSVTKLYHRMAKTWPTEGVVDDTVRATASKVLTVSVELKKAIKAAQRAHQRELKLNAKPRKNARAESKWDSVGRRPSN
jgi:hypothetical protein